MSFLQVIKFCYAVFFFLHYVVCRLFRFINQEKHAHMCIFACTCVCVFVCESEGGGVLNEKEDAMKMNLHKLNFKKQSNVLNESAFAM